MQSPSNLARIRVGMQIALCIAITLLGDHRVSAQIEKKAEREQLIGKLTRYEVKPASQESFRKALADYVGQALLDESNVQAEAYHEQDKPSVLWLIERWRTRDDLTHFAKNPHAQALESLLRKALTTGPQTFFVQDLTPLSKEAWRRTPKSADQPLTVMLFVDAKPGTQDHFMATYQTALPQFRSQPGVVTYQLSRVAGNDTRFVTYEKFRSPAAFQAHLVFPPIKPVLEYLQTSIQKQPFQQGLHTLVEFAPGMRE